MIAQPLAVVLFCLALGLEEFRAGSRRARAAPDAAVAAITRLFSFAWGAWTFGLGAMATFFVLAAVNVALIHETSVPPGALTALLLVPPGVATSILLTAAGLVRALRSGRMIWIGEGTNQARILLRVLFYGTFTPCIVVPLVVLVIVGFEKGTQSWSGFAVCIGAAMNLLIAPVGVLLALDAVSRRVLAREPGKLGAKVSSIKGGMVSKL